MIIAEFFIQLIASTLLYILPLYMHAVNYSDVEIARYISYRFLGVVATTIPLGFLIKGRKLAGWFVATGIFMPLFTIISIEAIAHHTSWLIDVTQFLIGALFSFLSVAILPYILRNEKIENHTGAIALHYAIIGLSTVISGWMIGFLNVLNPVLFNEEHVLLLIGVLGFANLYFLKWVRREDKVPEMHTKKIRLREDFDWRIIGFTLIPATLIYLGAGLTIPFISLFFAYVHNMGTGAFALTSSASAVLVVIATLYIPFFKRKMGMRSTITSIQLMAVAALVLLASTQYYNQYHIAVIIAVAAYFIRNPLMNMVGPLTSELSMSYSGERNQELVSAFISAIASGGYFVSARAFKKLREYGVDYATIFFITALFYLAGIVFYYIIAGRHLKKKESGI